MHSCWIKRTNLGICTYIYSGAHCTWTFMRMDEIYSKVSNDAAYENSFDWSLVMGAHAMGWLELDPESQTITFVRNRCFCIGSALRSVARWIGCVGERARIMSFRKNVRIDSPRDTPLSYFLSYFFFFLFCSPIDMLGWACRLNILSAMTDIINIDTLYCVWLWKACTIQRRTIFIQMSWRFGTKSINLT